MTKQPSQNIQIRPFVPKYEDAVINLIVPIQQKEFNIDITAQDQPDLKGITGFYQKGSGNFWVAMHKKKIIGTISLLDIGNNQAALRKMFVSQQFRGAEYKTATLLLQHLISWAKTRYLTDIFLGTTPKFIAAHRFYEKNGFMEISKEKLPQPFPIMKVDTKFYHYSLKESK